MLRPSMTWQIPSSARLLAVARVMSTPSNTIRPSSGRSRPEAIRIVVLFPAPFGPSNATTPPAGTDTETSRSTVVLP